MCQLNYWLRHTDQTKQLGIWQVKKCSLVLQVRHTVLTTWGAQGMKGLISHLSKRSHHLYDESCCPVRKPSVSSGCNKASLHSHLSPTSTSGNAFPAGRLPLVPQPLRRAILQPPHAPSHRPATPPGHPGPIPSGLSPAKCSLA